MRPWHRAQVQDIRTRSFPLSADDYIVRTQVYVSATGIRRIMFMIRKPDGANAIHAAGIVECPDFPTATGVLESHGAVLITVRLYLVLFEANINSMHPPPRGSGSVSNNHQVSTNFGRSYVFRAFNTNNFHGIGDLDFAEPPCLESNDHAPIALTATIRVFPQPYKHSFLLGLLLTF